MIAGNQQPLVLQPGIQVRAIDQESGAKRLLRRGANTGNGFRAADSLAVNAKRQKIAPKRSFQDVRLIGKELVANRFLLTQSEIKAFKVYQTGAQ
jgi:hypothetical protein